MVSRPLINLKTSIKIESASFIEHILLLGGGEWNFSSMNPWRIVHDRKVVVSSDNTNANESLASIVGLEIKSIEMINNHYVEDLRLLFSNNRWMQIFSMCDIEHWTINLPDGTTIVHS